MTPIDVEFLDLDKRKYPIEFRIKRYPGLEDLYPLLKPYWISQYVDIEEYNDTGKPGCFLDDSDEDYLVFSIRMMNRLNKILYSFGYCLNLDSEVLKRFSITEFDLSNPFININNPMLGELRPEQYIAVKQMLSKVGHICEAATGYGKNTIITYLCSHYIGNGNILVLGPRYSILEEIQKRADQYNVAIGQDPNVDRAMYVHPSGFLNSNNTRDQVWLDWMDNVEVILIDECEGITDSMEDLLRNYCHNYKYIYGFSATADKYNGRRLDSIMGSISMMGVHWETYSILYFVGETGFYKGDNHKFTIYINYVDGLKREYILYEGESFNSQYSRMEKSMINSNQYFEYLKYAIAMSTGTILVPVKTIDQCDMLWEKLTKFNPLLSIGYWTGQGSYYYNGNGDINNFVELDDAYTQLVDLVDNKKTCKVLICTSVGYRGVDFKNINDVLLGVGGNNGIINQIAGRTTRGDVENLHIWLIGNYEDIGKWEGQKTPILDSVVAKRKRFLMEQHETEVKLLHNCAPMDRDSINYGFN